jgi:hypothetical protein
MTGRVALLLEAPDGNTFAVVCGSREAADKIREASPYECVGVTPIISRVEAVLVHTDRSQA